MVRPFHSIVVGFDASPSSEEALEVALDLVGESGRVLAVTVLDPTNHVGDRRRTASFARSTGGENAERVRAGVLQDTSLPRDAARTMSRSAPCPRPKSSNAAAMSRLSTHSRRRFGEGGAMHPKLGHVARSLAHRCELPVLLWKRRS